MLLQRFSRYSLDSKNTEIAINKLNDFITRFPNSEKVEESDKLINELREKLAKNNLKMQSNITKLKTINQQLLL